MRVVSVWMVLLLGLASGMAAAAVWPIGDKHNADKLIITLDLGESWYSKSTQRMLSGHLGQDMVLVDGQVVGTPVRAIAAGEVTFAGSGGTGWGPVVEIRHVSLGLSSMYAHLQNIRVSVGQHVAEGEQIAEVGRLEQWAPHLHFELKTDDAIEREGLVGHGYSGTDGLAAGRRSIREILAQSSAPEPDLFRVIKTSPSDGKLGVDPAHAIAFELSHPVDERQVSVELSPNLVLVDLRYVRVTGGGKVVSVAGQTLLPNRVYTVTLKARRSDDQHQTLVKCITFKTGPLPEAPRITAETIDSLAPEGYEVRQYRVIDLNGDGREDVILASQAKGIRFDQSDAPRAKIQIYISHRGNWIKAWEYPGASEREVNYLVGRGERTEQGEPMILARKLGKSKDGTHQFELFFTLGIMGASEAYITEYGYRFGIRGTSVTSRLVYGGNPSKTYHNYDGGFLVGEGVVCTYSWYADYKTDPHRYIAKVYRWNPKQNCYALSAKFTTKTTARAGVAEVKRRFVAFR